MIARSYIVAFVISCGVSCLATLAVREFARKFKLTDKPDSKRKIHTVPIPSLGGVGIFLGFFAPITGLLIYINKFSHSLMHDISEIIALYVGGALTLLIGLYDDIRGAKVLEKLAAQCLIACVVFAFGYRIEVLNLPVLGVVQLGYLSFPLTLLWIVAIMNAVNLIDGLDGLAAGVSFIALMTIFVMSLLDGNHLVGLFTASLAGAVLGFWFFNFNPASIFMGDSGSLFLGFVLSIMSISSSYKGTIALGILPLIALGIPVLDVFMAVFRRMSSKRSIFKADSEHIHHRLLSLGFSQRQVVIIIYTFCVLLSMIALILKQANPFQSYIALLTSIIIITLLVRFVTIPSGYVFWNRDFSKEAALTPDMLRVTGAFLSRLRKDDYESLTDAFASLASLGRFISLRAEIALPTGKEFNFSYGDAGATSVTEKISVPIINEGKVCGSITATVAPTEGKSIVGKLIALYMLSNHISLFLSSK